MERKFDRLSWIEFLTNCKFSQKIVELVEIEFVLKCLMAVVDEAAVVAGLVVVQEDRAMIVVAVPIAMVDQGINHTLLKTI